MTLFSHRLEFDLRPNRLTSCLSRKKRDGEEILDLSLSNPTRAGFVYPYDRLIDGFAGSLCLEYSPDPKGLPRARKAVSEYYAQRGKSVLPDDIIITASTSEAYSFLFRLLADPGERIITPVPGYPLFDYLLRLDGLEPAFFQMRYSNGWWYDLDQGLFDDSVKGLIIVSPANPTGNYVHGEEWTRIAALCGNAGVPIIFDEVFNDFPHPAAGPSVNAVEETETLVFVLNGFSKTAGMPQLKMSWIVLCGPEDIKREAKKKLELISDTYLSASTAVQAASPDIFRLAPLVRRQINERVKNNLDYLGDSVKDSPADLLRSEGGWSAIIRVPELMKGEDWAVNLLDNRNILAHPGEFYSLSGGSYLILSLLPRESDFKQGVSMLMEAVSGSI